MYQALSDTEPLKLKPPKKSKVASDKEKEYIPKYKPKPVTKTKRQAPPGAIKKGEYRGLEALSEEDKEFIADNARKMSVDDIADARGKRRIAVYNYID